MMERDSIRIEHKKASKVARLDRVLGDKLRRKVVINEPPRRNGLFFVVHGFYLNDSTQESKPFWYFSTVLAGPTMRIW